MSSGAVKVAELISHPQNGYFFDDMLGTKWEEFVESVKTSGVIEPIVITQNNVIVSGHQRVRACIELGIEEVPFLMREYVDDDSIIKDLIETNIRQRGNIDSSSIKLARIIKELERLYGVQHGGDRGASSENANLKTQDEIMDELGIKKDAYHRTKKLLDLIPEFQDMVEENMVPKTVASTILAKLSPDEQRELLQQLPADVRLTQRDVEAQMAIMMQKDKMVEEARKENADLERRLEKAVKDKYAIEETIEKIAEEKLADLAAEEIKKRDIALMGQRSAEERLALLRRQLEEERNKAKIQSQMLVELQSKVATTIVPDDYDEIKIELQKLREEKDQQRFADRNRHPNNLTDKPNNSTYNVNGLMSFCNLIISEITAYQTSGLFDDEYDASVSADVSNKIEQTLSVIGKLRNKVMIRRSAELA